MTNLRVCVFIVVSIIDFFILSTIIIDFNRPVAGGLIVTSKEPNIIYA